jgi:L-fucose isomerase-like protein
MKVKFLECSLRQPSETVVAQAREELRSRGLRFEEGGGKPDVLVFVTGGTESEAIRWVADGTVLIPVGTNNGLAASLEVKAWAETRGLSVSLVADRLDDPEFIRAFNALSDLRGLRVGVVGEPSDWLVKSGDRTLLDELGVLAEPIDLKEVLDLARDDESLAAKLMSRAGECAVTAKSVGESARFHNALESVASRKKLAGLSIRCFDLIQQHDVAACLALGLLNEAGVVAGCEGDLETLATMLLASRLTGKPGFMANPADYSDGVLTMAHCTIDLSLVDRFDLVTHFESDRSVAISGWPVGEVFTIARLGRGRRFTAVEARRVERERVASMCRTQLSLRVGRELFDRALGNHHVVIPGAWGGAFYALKRLGWRSS